MAKALHIDAPVVTGDLLGREHKGERTLSVAPSAILTPTAWDYIRQHRLQLSRGEAVAAAKPLRTRAGVSIPTAPVAASTRNLARGTSSQTRCGDCAVHERKKAGRSRGELRGLQPLQDAFTTN